MKFSLMLLVVLAALIFVVVVDVYQSHVIKEQRAIIHQLIDGQGCYGPPPSIWIS